MMMKMMMMVLMMMPMKSKFLEVETEAARVKIMVAATKGLLGNVQNSLDEIEGGKRNNLIFHGVVAEHPETQIRCGFVAFWLLSDSYFIDFSLKQRLTIILKTNVNFTNEWEISRCQRLEVQNEKVENVEKVASFPPGC